MQFRRAIALGLLALASLNFGARVNAATKYWDIDGATAGAGGATPAGTWDTATANWTTDSTGASAATTWAAGDAAVFAAGTDATGTYSVTLLAASTQDASGITVEEGNVTITGGTALNLSGAAALSVAPGSLLTLTSKVTGIGPSTVAGGGAVLLNNTASTNSGPINVSGGSTLQIASSAAIGSTLAGSGAITLNGGTFQNNSTGAGITFLSGNRGFVLGAGNGTINVAGTSANIQIYTSGSFTTSGGGTTLTKTGGGTLRVTTPTSVTFSKLVVTGGLYQAATDSIFGAVPGSYLADAITLNGGGLGVNGGVAFHANRGITLGAAGGSIDGTSSPTVAGKITGVGALTKAGTGTLTLSAANDFTGALNVNAGIVTITGTNTPSAVNLNAGRINFNNSGAVGSATINVANAAGIEFTNSVAGITLANNVVLAAGSNPVTIYSTSGNSLVQTGQISGARPLQRTDTGAGSFTLAGDNSFSGGLTVISRGITFGHKNGAGTGTLTLGDTATAPLNAITIQSSTSLTGANALGNAVVVNRDFTIAGSSGIELSGGVNLGAASRTVTVSNTAASVLSGVITGGAGAGITKAGTGALTLSGPNTYTGPTVITSGTLYANNTSGSATGTGSVTVNAGTGIILGGTGTVGGATTVNGTLAPGTSVGTLTFGSTVDIGATGIFLVEYNSNDQTIDLATIAGTLSIASGATISFADLGAGALTLPSYVFATFASGGTRTFATLGVPTGYSVFDSGTSLALVQDVPEASSFLALAAATAVSTIAYRRRQKNAG